MACSEIPHNFQFLETLTSTIWDSLPMMGQLQAQKGGKRIAFGYGCVRLVV